MKVLIVDDSSVMRKLVLRGLRQAGYGGHEFSEAENGKQALDKVMKAAPDLILCDWNMPEMTGIEFLEAIKKNEIDVKFCFVTSEATDSMKSQATAAGADAFVTKPFTSEALEQSLGKFLG